MGEDFPRAFWMLDDITPFDDYSGYECFASCANVEKGVALVKGASRSLIVSNEKRLTAYAPYFLKGKEYLPFTIGAFVRPIINDLTDPDPIQILGNEGQMDGLILEGTVVHFVTKYTSTGEARCSFDMMDYQSMGVWGVHTQSKNMLVINGDTVAEIDITPAQQADTFVGTGGTLSSGATNSTNKLMLNAVAVYDTPLDEDSTLTQFANAQDTLGAEDVALDYGGALLEFAPEGALHPYFQIEYSSEQEWGLGFRTDCNMHDGTLYPASSQGISLPGRWETAISLGVTESTIYAANLIWEGVGAEVSTSRNGVDYTPAQKAKNLTTIPKGLNGENQFLYVRVSFPGGIANDPSFFDDMVFSLYSFSEEPTFNGREVVLDKVSLEDDLDVIDLHENWGAEMQGGTITIKAGDPIATATPKTIEVWGNKNGATFTDNLSGAVAKYSNGGAQKPYQTGEWQLRHYVFDAGFTGDITFSGTGQIGHVVLYPEALDAATIKEIYQSYTGKPKVYVEVDEVFNIHEFNGLVDIYEYDWSIETSG